MTTHNLVRLVFPNQLFREHLNAAASTRFILIEDDLFFQQYKFHKQKLVLHRATMQVFSRQLEEQGFSVEYIESSSQTSSMDQLEALLTKLSPKSLSYYELSDIWLTQRIEKLIKNHSITAERLVSPGFLTTLGQIDEFFNTNPNRMQQFYEWQRKRLNVLINTNGKPTGGKWSFDAANRKKLPKNLVVAQPYPELKLSDVDEAKTWVESNFPKNPGMINTFSYPITHGSAEKQLHTFLRERLKLFGPYEDAISSQEPQIFHSILSPLLNIGLLTPQQVLDAVLHYADKNNIPIESLEGFIRQLIGWREYMRATYLHYGTNMRNGNFLNFNNKLDKRWWGGTVGLVPVDTVIKRVIETGYAHHIERLMILGNIMVLLRINPNEVYEWFMSLFIDAYDWVMVPNVYAMSQFAAGDKITTKPYVSGSNYIIKMSDYKKGEWSETWDALYWAFINDYRKIIEKNYRSRMLVNIYDSFDSDKKQRLNGLAKQYIL